MLAKYEMSFEAFYDAFINRFVGSIHYEAFSKTACQAIYKYYDENGIEFNNDFIKLLCIFSEYYIKDFIADYKVEGDVVDFLEDKGVFYHIFDDKIVFEVF